MGASRPLPPTVTGVTPTYGPQTGLTNITITGTNFIDVAGVTVGNVSASNILVTNSSTLTATTGNSPTGTYSINVTNPIGTSNSTVLFNYLATTRVYQGSSQGDGSGLFAVPGGESYPCIANVDAGWTVNYSNGMPTGWTVTGFSFFPPPPGYVAIKINTNNFISGNYTFTAAQSLAGNVTPYYSPVGGSGSNPQFVNVTSTYPSLNDVAAGWRVYAAAVGGGVSSIGNVISVAVVGGYNTVSTTAPASPRYDAYRFGTS